MSSTTTYIIGIIVLAGLAVGIYFAVAKSKEPARYTAFAQCLEESGTTFYGAFWCPHCQDQKAMFGRAQKDLPYVECSTADRRGQTAKCQTESITSYPTWEFPDGSRQTGALSFEVLAEGSGCALPSDENPEGTSPAV